MKKLNKRGVFSIVLALMLVFTVGFYSSAEQTTAWFTDYGSESQDFSMDSINVEYAGYNPENMVMQFDAATKFDDADERAKMFEHTCKFFTFTVTNNGPRDAYVFIDIANNSETQGNSTDIGALRYYICEYDPNENVTYTAEQINQFTKITPDKYESDSDTLIESGVLVDSDGKRVIESNGEYFRISPMISEDTDATACEVGGEPLLIELDAPEAGEESRSKSFCCVFWVEYDEFIDVVPNENGVRTAKFNVDISVNAVQADYYPVSATE